ncbi:hypothetical protein SEA_LEWAN_123 [Mycobacterium phage Lewan]|nr:hypothetical protein SEA_LEWAN_123 [Mycobacterium phage Lewan]
MMKRETLKDWRRPTTKMDYHPSAERERQVIDSHLEALDTIDVLREEIADLRPLVEKCENFEIEVRRLNRELEAAREAAKRWQGPVA